MATKCDRTSISARTAAHGVDTIPCMRSNESHSPTFVWAKLETIQREIAEAPRDWFYNFAAEHRESVRKFSKAKNGTLLFRVEDVLTAIANMEVCV